MGSSFFFQSRRARSADLHHRSDFQHKKNVTHSVERPQKNTFWDLETRNLHPNLFQSRVEMAAAAAAALPLLVSFVLLRKPSGINDEAHASHVALLHYNKGHSRWARARACSLNINISSKSFSISCSYPQKVSILEIAVAAHLVKNAHLGRIRERDTMWSAKKRNFKSFSYKILYYLYSHSRAQQSRAEQSTACRAAVMWTRKIYI